MEKPILLAKIIIRRGIGKIYQDFTARINAKKMG